MEQIWAILWAVELGWAVRIWWLRLAHRHPFLVAYLLLSVVNSLAASRIIAIYGQDSTAYAWMWTTMRPVLWMLLLLVLAESYAHAFGVKRIGLRGSLTVGVLASLAACISFALGDSVRPGNFWIRQEQSVYVWLLLIEVFLVLLARSVGRIERNDAIVFAVLGLLALAHVAVTELRNLSGWATEIKARYEIMAGLYAGLQLLGAVGFRKSSEGKS